MRTILKLGYTSYLLQEGIDIQDVVNLFENTKIVQRSNGAWIEEPGGLNVEIVAVTDRSIQVDTEEEKQDAKHE